MTDQPNPSNPAPHPGEFSASVERPQVAAIVPESVARGVFATAPLVFTGQHELAIDFMQSMAKPNTLAARVVLPPGVAAQFVAVLQQNLQMYRDRFGGPVEPPPPAAPPPAPDVKELYERHKIADHQLSGVYANAVLITHSYSDFCFDFITTFFPKAAVSARVFLAAPVVPGFLRMLQRSVEQYQQKLMQLQQEWLKHQNPAAPKPPTDPQPPFPGPHLA